MANTFQHLLLATEHTPFDTGAERLAFAIARRCEQPLHAVLPLVSNPEFVAKAPDLATRADQQAAAQIAELHETAQAEGVTLALRARHGPEPDREIVDEARERGSDLLVIRRRGQRSFLAQLLLGEMVSKVVAHAPCHVLIVPRDAQMWSRRVLVAAEPGPHGHALVRLAAQLAGECGLPLSIVCVDEGGSAGRDAAATLIREAMAWAERAGVQASGEVRQGRPAECILQAVRDADADLTVVGRRSHSMLARALLGSVAHKVIGQTSQPVLVAQVPLEENHRP